MKKKFSQLYVEIKKIGNGSFGVVWLVQNKETKEFFVNKKIHIFDIDEEKKNSISLEVNFLKLWKHPHIVEYKDFFIENGYIMILMEYCEEGDLSNIIKRNKKLNDYFPEQVILNLFLQIAVGLEFIHSKKILHRDLKSSNIFITNKGLVKIGDFGISKILNGTVDYANTMVGTPYIMSPEVCKNNPYSFKSDIWSLGCIVYEMCNLKRAFNGDNFMSLFNAISKGKFEPVNEIYSLELRNIISLMLTKDIEKRPNILQILNIDIMFEVFQNFLSKTNQSQRNKNDNIQKNLIVMTPKEKLLHKKKLEADKRMIEINEAIKSNYSISNKSDINNSTNFNINDSTYKGDSNFIINSSLAQSNKTNESDYVLNNKLIKEDKTLNSIDLTDYSQTNNNTMLSITKTIENNMDDQSIDFNYSKLTNNWLINTKNYEDNIEYEYTKLNFNKKSSKKLLNKTDILDEFPEDFENSNELDIYFSSDEEIKDVKAEKIKQNIIKDIGEDNFKIIYNYFKKEKKKDTNLNNIRNYIKSNFNKKCNSHGINFEQILLIEENKYNK